jgi:hypothetical protein
MALSGPLCVRQHALSPPLLSAAPVPAPLRKEVPPEASLINALI